jgi:hypothetical protein
MTFPIGNHGQQNTLAAKHAGREAKMAAAKEIVNKNLTTVREIVTPVFTQEVVNNKYGNEKPLISRITDWLFNK